MIGTKFYKPLQDDELPVYEDKPVFEGVVVLEEKAYTEQVDVFDENGNAKLDENGNPVVETVEFKVKEPKLDENGNVVTEEKQVFDKNGKPVTQREQVGTKPNDAPNTLSKYAQAAEWCNANKATIEDKGDYYEVVALPEPTPEELQAQALAMAKSERASEVEAITVEVDGLVFDGDEKSQERMARSIISLNDDETITWVLHDNTIANVTKEQLKTALRLAGQKQTELWTKPYENAVA